MHQSLKISPIFLKHKYLNESFLVIKRMENSLFQTLDIFVAENQ